MTTWHGGDTMLKSNCGCIDRLCRAVRTPNIVALGLTAALSACGGGGGSDASDAAGSGSGGGSSSYSIGGTVSGLSAGATVVLQNNADDFTLQAGSPAAGAADTSVSPKPAWHFATPPPASNPTLTPPAADPPSVFADVAPRAAVTDLGAQQD